jgi:hypothetical protein
MISDATEMRLDVVRPLKSYVSGGKIAEFFAKAGQ